jgi:CHAT domain-containing protein/Tfp pilus assembly protein PilF
MTKTVLRYLLLLVPLFLFLFISLSQGQPDRDQRLLLTEFREIKKIYDSATELGNSESYTEAREMELNERALKKFSSFFPKLPQRPAYDSLRFFTGFYIGELEHYFEHFREALNGYSQAIAIQLKSNLPDSLLFKPYMYSGIIYYNQNEYDSAAFYFQNAEKIQTKYNYGLQESERLYNTFGALYYEKGDYRQAKNYFLKAIEVLPPTHIYYRELFTTYNINLAQIYFKLEDYDQANRIYQKLLQLNPANQNEILHNIGMINLYLGAPAKALNYFRQVKYTDNKIIYLYHNIGESFFNLEQYDSAGIYFQKAISAHNSFGSNTDHIAYGQTLKSMGDLEMHFGRPLEAVIDYQHAMEQFYPTYFDTSKRSNPHEFSGVFSYINLFNTLVAKADAFQMLYEQDRSIAWQQEELRSYQSAFQLTDYVERTYNSDEARLFLDKIKYIVHTKPIDLAFDLYSKTKDKKYLEDLYVFDQQNKASVLSVKTQFNEQLMQKDSSVISKERAIRSEITRLSLRASQLNDSIEIKKLTNAIRDREIELGKIQEGLSGGVVANRIPSISSLQNNLLDKKTLILSFHLSDDRITILHISAKRFNCYQKPLFPGFHDSVANYINSTRNPDPGTPVELSKKLFAFLFDSADLKDIERLILIPDDELNYLSFESLQDDAGQYLVQKYTVQYQYSTSLLKKESIDFSDHKTLAFAPFTKAEFVDSSLTLEQLPNSLKEVIDLNGKQYTDTAATKANFLNGLSQYKVLHLATHAIINTSTEDLSFISFYPAGKNHQDFLLYTEEIYNLPLNKTSLVILSACETGSGNLVKGEGIMSLSRAFAYAGCSNIITSLWKANDFSTAYLTSRIHHYLDKDYTIDAALRKAKLDYINDPSVNPRLKTPFYWSHLIFIGNYSPAKTKNYWLLIAIACLIVIVCFVWWKKSR